MKKRSFRFPKKIAVLHLPQLLGAPIEAGVYRSEDHLSIAGERALSEARILEKAGFDALIIENFGDIPFYKNQVPPETVCSMGILAAAVKESVKIPVGINVLRNDARSALAIASVTGCEFIRVNVLSGIAATDQGLIESEAASILRERARFNSAVHIYADVHVKHAQTLSSQSIAYAVEEVATRAMASAVIISGVGTGHAVDFEHLKAASSAARNCKVPVYIGSGVTPENWEGYRPWADGVIVSSALRQNGRAGAPLDRKRISKMIKSLSLRARSTRAAAKK